MRDEACTVWSEPHVLPMERALLEVIEAIQSVMGAVDLALAALSEGAERTCEAVALADPACLLRHVWAHIDHLSQQMEAVLLLVQVSFESWDVIQGCEA